MIKSMIFAGCSFTWGQSLHYYGNFPDDQHPKDGQFYGEKLLPSHYQYNIDNRFPTTVSDYFGKKPIVLANNGGDNFNSLMFIKKVLNGGNWEHGRNYNPTENVDCIIFQTTSFARAWTNHNVDENHQIAMIVDLVKEVESMGILIKFINFDWEEHMIPDFIKERTIKFEGKYSWYHIINPQTKDLESLTSTDWDDRLVAHEFPQTGDRHFNPKGHKFIHDLIVDSLIKEGYGEEYNPLQQPKYVNHKLYFHYTDYNKVLNDFNNSDYNKDKHSQLLLYSHDKDSVAYDYDYTHIDTSKLQSKFSKYELLNIWIMVYPPNTYVGWHCDDSTDFNRYVYEIEKSKDGYFEWILGNRFLKVDNKDEDGKHYGNKYALLIGDYIHRYVNESNTETRISMVFDTKKSIGK